VYYYAWFHECGHTRKITGGLAPQSLKARIFFLGEKYKGELITQVSLRAACLRAEKKPMNSRSMNSRSGAGSGTKRYRFNLFTMARD